MEPVEDVPYVADHPSSTLRRAEVWWRDRTPLLQRHGYILRPRFRPGWTPSWLGTDCPSYLCEDYHGLLLSQLMDATRIADSKRVFIKRIAAVSSETAISTYLSSPELLKDSTNHCVPILDSFKDDADKSVAFIVMPVLRQFDDPPFYSINEVVEFFKQTLEGLAFMHRQGVAHLDCSNGNIMMDGDPLFPEGFHPALQNMTPSCDNDARALRRKDASPVKYFFIDFGISVRYDLSEASRLVVGQLGQDQEVPELSAHVPYDPVKADVFILGNVYRKQFLERYSNLDFLEPLVDAMTRRDPDSRPSSPECLAQFEELLSQKARISLRWQLRSRGESLVTRAFKDCWVFARERLDATISFRWIQIRRR